MTRTGHHFTGLACGIAIAACLEHFRHLGLVAWTCVPAGWMGGVAPDALEWIVPGKKRWCKHRTITHWWPLWAYGLYQGMTHMTQAWGPAWMAYCLCAFSHLACDWPNPTGIPFTHPWDRRSLGLWKSGQMEWLLVPGWAAFSAAVVYVLR